MTAKDHLYKILDYQYLWILPQNKNRKSAKLRLKQIESLLAAFGLTKKHVNPLLQIKYFVGGNKNGLDRVRHLNKLTNLEYLLHGEFLHDREKEANAELSTKIIETITLLYPEMIDHINLRNADMVLLLNNCWLCLFRIKSKRNLRH